MKMIREAEVMPAPNKNPLRTVQPETLEDLVPKPAIFKM